MKCFYCEKEEATKGRFGKPSCDKCYTSYLVTQVEKLQDELTQEELANRYKTLLNSFSLF